MKVDLRLFSRKTHLNKTCHKIRHFNLYPINFSQTSRSLLIPQHDTKDILIFNEPIMTEKLLKIPTVNFLKILHSATPIKLLLNYDTIQFTVKLVDKNYKEPITLSTFDFNQQHHASSFYKTAD